MNSKDARLLRRYARFMFRRAMAERAAEMARQAGKLLPPPKDWVDAQVRKAIESDGHRKVVAWFEGLPTRDRGAARRRLNREMDGEATA